LNTVTNNSPYIKYLFNYTPLRRPDRCFWNEVLCRCCLQNMFTLNPSQFLGAI